LLIPNAYFQPLLRIRIFFMKYTPKVIIEIAKHCIANNILLSACIVRANKQIIISYIPYLIANELKEDMSIEGYLIDRNTHKQLEKTISLTPQEFIKSIVGFDEEGFLLEKVN